jgi:hypothetical protein
MVMAIGKQHQMNFSAEIWKQIQFSNTEEDLVHEQNQNNKLKEKGVCFVILFDRVGSRSWNGES